jgi:hypothetical protein
MKKFNQTLGCAFFSGLILLMVSISGCGNGSSNCDPLQLVDSSTSANVSSSCGGVVYLSAIVPYTGTLNNPLSSVYSASQPYWLFLASSFSGFGGYYSAPAAGLVTSVGVANISGISGSYITIVHSPHLATQLFGIQSLNNIQAGSYVVQGQNLGTYFSTGNLGFKVLYDGVAVCPLSFLTPQFQAQFSFGSNPCL